MDPSVDQEASDRRPSTPSSDPSWTLVFNGTAPLPRVRESLCSLANGWIGTRASGEEEPPGSDPRVMAAGVYDDAEPPGLLTGPRWTRLALDTSPVVADRWTLDLRTGVLSRRVDTEAGTLRSLRFVSLARPGCAVMRLESPNPFDPGPPLVEGPPGSNRGGTELTTTSARGAIAAVADQRARSQPGTHTVERIAAYVADSGRVPDTEEAGAVLARLLELGSDRLFAEHQVAWSRRWEDAGISIHGDPESELALRFSLFHLMSSAPTEGEAAVGARGLTGPAYRGHVFWDTDVFVLPALAATVPGAARAILEYRVRRLPAAREAAAREGASGARFPWESADDGTDVTPTHWIGPEGVEVPIRTGSDEIHIVADVAWAAQHYVRWTGDEGFLAGPGRGLILDTARYWASRAEAGRHGRMHLLEVMGPDEYHQQVDDNAFTNVMARANLRWAAGVARRFGGADPEEIGRWLGIADRLVDGYDDSTGVYRQFTGYFDLDPVRVEEVAGPPVAADVLLGRDRVAGSQIVKQADVLMLHHLVPEEVVAGSLEPNLRRYLPFTAHGSSLSPPIHASVLARAGRVEEALEWFRLAGRLDLDDLTGTTAGGVHLGAMGGLWQALTLGFLGLAVDAGGLIRLDPRLPGSWDAVVQHLIVGGARLRLEVGQDRVEVESDRPVRLSCGDGTAPIPRAGFRFVRSPDGWKELA